MFSIGSPRHYEKKLYWRVKICRSIFQLEQLELGGVSAEA